MPKTAQDLFNALESLHISYLNHRHAPVMTVAESQALRGAILGLHSKNLLLKDKKGGLWLVVAEEARSIDLKGLRKVLGAQNLSFASAETLMDALGVPPGAVTPFALINDGDGRVRFVLDQALAEAEAANFHPLDNAQTTTVRGPDLVRFAASLGHPPHILDFSALP